MKFHAQLSWAWNFFITSGPGYQIYNPIIITIWNKISHYYKLIRKELKCTRRTWMPLPISFYNIKYNRDSKSESAQMIFLVRDTSSPLVACTCEATWHTFKRYMTYGMDKNFRPMEINHNLSHSCLWHFVPFYRMHLWSFMTYFFKRYTRYGLDNDFRPRGIKTCQREWPFSFATYNYSVYPDNVPKSYTCISKSTIS